MYDDKALLFAFAVSPAAAPDMLSKKTNTASLSSELHLRRFNHDEPQRPAESRPGRSRVNPNPKAQNGPKTLYNMVFRSKSLKI